MKLFPLVILTLLLFSCSDLQKKAETKEELETLRKENVELKEAVEANNEEINDFIESFNEIQNSLDTIKEREKLVTITTSSPELQKTKQQEIANDINMINELIIKNRQKISGLNKKLIDANEKLKSTGIKIAELEKIIKRFSAQLDEKDTQIATLVQNLENANAAYKELFTEYNARLDEIEAQNNKINTAHYAFGTAKELIEKGVVTKEGGFIGIGKAEKLKNDFNKDYFTTIDITETISILLACKKAKVITTHPSNSYALEGDNGNINKLVIKDPPEFWSTSKYLVIVTEQ